MQDSSAFSLLPAALAAAARLDSPRQSAAERAQDLAVVTGAAGVVREVTAWLEGPATDALVWALHVHGELSQARLARLLGYGQGGAGRHVRTIQIRLAREQRRRIGDLAVALVALAATGAAEQVVVPTGHPAGAQSADAVADAVAQLRAAAAADVGTQGTTGTTAALEALAAVWGTAAPRLLTELQHAVFTAGGAPAGDGLGADLNAAMATATTVWGPQAPEVIQQLATRLSGQSELR